jgi:hypothetical protein
MSSYGGKFEPLFDVHPVTGVSIEVFYAGSPPRCFGRGSAGWHWHFRQRGYAANGPAVGPFSSAYLAFRHALISVGSTQQATQLPLGLMDC